MGRKIWQPTNARTAPPPPHPYAINSHRDKRSSLLTTCEMHVRNIRTYHGHTPRQAGEPREASPVGLTQAGHGSHGVRVRQGHPAIPQQGKLVLAAPSIADWDTATAAPTAPTAAYNKNPGNDTTKSSSNNIQD